MTTGGKGQGRARAQLRLTVRRVSDAVESMLSPVERVIARGPYDAEIRRTQDYEFARITYPSYLVVLRDLAEMSDSLYTPEPAGRRRKHQKD
jgi:hypothetical protein